MIGAQTSAQVTAGAKRYTVHKRLFMEHADGVMYNFGDLGGVNWLNRAKWGKSVDDAGCNVTLELRREVGGQSLAPLVVGSPLNELADGTYARRIHFARVFRVEVAITPVGVAPVAGDWFVAVRGITDGVSWGGKESVITITARDNMALLDTPILTGEEHTFGTAGGLSLEVVMQDVLDHYLGAAAPTLAFAAPLGFNVTNYTTKAGQTLREALDALAGHVGGYVEDRWNATLAAHALTVMMPNRNADTAPALATFNRDQYLLVDSTKWDDRSIRNHFVHRFRDSGGTVVTNSRTNFDSVADLGGEPHGKRPIEFTEPEGSALDTEGESDAFLLIVDEDLSSAVVQQTVTSLFWPWVELGDYYQWEPNFKTTDLAYIWAIVGFEHELSGTKLRTTFRTSGHARGGVRRYMRLAQPEAGAGPAGPKGDTGEKGDPGEDAIGNAIFETFPELPPGLGGAGYSIATVAESSGGKVLRVANTHAYWNPVHLKRIPFNRNALYRVEVRVRATQDSGVSNSPHLYAGVTVSGADGVMIHSVYAAAYAQPVTVADGWVTYTGWIRGTGAAAAAGIAPDPMDPSGTGTTQAAFLSPVLLINYNVTTTQDTEVDYFLLEAVDTEYAEAVEDVAIAAAALAQVNAEAHADGVVSAEEDARIAQAEANLATAEAFAAAEARKRVMMETFDELKGYWTRSTGSGPLPSEAVVVPLAGTAGGTVVQAKNYHIWYAEGSQAMPFDPSTLYKLQCRVRILSDSTSGANQLFYAGLQGLDANMVSVTGNLYILASAQLLVETNGWVTYTAWVRGRGGASSNSWDSLSPSGIGHATASFISPILLLNYNASTSNQVTQVDYFIIEAVDEGLVEKSKEQVYQPTVRSSVTWSGQEAAIYIVADDPLKKITNIQWQTQAQAGTFTPLSTAWNSTTGNYGLSTYILRNRDVIVGAGADVTFLAYITFTDENGATKQLTVNLPLANLQPVAKSIFVPCSAMVPMNSDTPWKMDNAGGERYLYPNHSSAIVSDFYTVPLVIPIGLTLNKLLVRAHKGNAGYVMKVKLVRTIDGATIAEVDMPTTGGLTNAEDVFGEVTGPTTSYSLEIEMYSPGSPVGVRFALARIYYTAPTYAHTY